MGSVSDKIFKHSYYKAVCQSFSDASTRYKKGFAEYLKPLTSYNLEDYEFRKRVHERIAEIREMDGVICAGEAISSSYSEGVREFRRRMHYEANDKSYEFYKQVVQRQEDIKHYDHIILEYNRYRRKNQAAVDLFVGARSATFEKKEFLVNHTDQIDLFIREYEHYSSMSVQFPLSISAYVGATLSVDKIEYIFSDIKQADLITMEEFLSTKAAHTEEIKSIIKGEGVNISDGEFAPDNISAIKKVLDTYKEHVRIDKIKKQYSALARQCPCPISLYFGKAPHTLSIKEQETALKKSNEIKEIQDLYYDPYGFTVGDYGDYLQKLVSNAERGKKYQLPKDPDEVRLTVEFNKKIQTTSSKLVAGVIPYVPEYDDLSDGAMVVRRNYFTYLHLNYCDVDIMALPAQKMSGEVDKKALFASIFNSTKYGNGVTFYDGYSIKSAYALEQKIEECGTTFDDCFAFIKKNLAAIKAYHKSKSGEDKWFIEDFELVAEKNAELLNFIDEVKRKDEIVREVQSIQTTYRLGYQKYVERNSIPEISDASIAQLKNIIDHKSDIERIHIFERAKDIIASNSDAAKSKFGPVTVMRVQLSQEYDTAKQIVASENELRRLQIQIVEKREFNDRIARATNGWDTVGDIPHYFFYWYYPTRFTDVSMDSSYARGLIYRFKDGDDHDEVATMVESKIRSTFKASDLSSLTFVCIPASTIAVNRDRYCCFSAEVCDELGMRDAFDHITITREKTASHLGGTDAAEYSFDKSFFEGAHVILFDDVVTRGRSMREFKSRLESMGATVVCAISIGRTYSDYYGDNRQPHPYTGRI